MNRILGIIIAIVIWCGIAAYIVWAGNLSRQKRSEVTVTDMRVAVADTSSPGVISPEQVWRWLGEGNFDMTGKPVGEANTAEIVARLLTHPEVKEAHAWVNLDGVLNVRVSQRQPIMRVRSTNGYRFWFTDDGYIIPDRGEFTAYVPVVTGAVPFGFGTGAKGSYDAILEASWQDFLGRFAAIENERRSLVAQKTGLQKQISDVRRKRPGRLRSKTFKTEFAKRKNEQTAALQEQTNHLDDGLAALAAGKNALREKEKKSQQSHRFLLKLANFVKSVEADGFWASQIVQINVFGGGETAGNKWKEPEIELVPRVGDHIVLLGELDGGEKRRLEKLREFYLGALAREGWDTQTYINIKYDGQVVCSK